MEDALANFRVPIGVIGVFVDHPNSQGGVLKAVHALEKYPGTVGRHDPDWHSVFGCEADVLGIDIQSIKLEQEMFDCTVEV